MGKKIFVLIVVLMSISLIGIISVQLYWINNAIESKDLQFSGDVKKALARVSERIEIKEEDLYLNKIQSFIETKQFLSKAQIKNFLIQQIDTTTKSRFSFGTTIIEEDFKIPVLDILDKNGFYDNDSIVVKRFTKKRDFFKGTFLVGKNDFKSTFNEKKFSKIDKLEELDTKLISDVFKDFYKTTFSIEERINNREINTTLKEELERNNIKIEFKYGVYNNGLATKLKSGYYTIDPEKSMSYPLFINNEGISDYTLYIDFPQKSRHILSDISFILLLSLFFIFIIIVAFSSSLYQLVKQKKISEIKTDFINNMTHEFKTPIATINLALDSIINPKIIHNEEKVLRYIKMIRDENKRMHGQVENVLRISRLEKNQLEFATETSNMHDVIDDAISHVSLLAIDKKGSITTHFEAIKSEALVNQFHMTNVLVNILENALKYSEVNPKIDVYTENTNKNLIIKIKDEGIGMAKNAQKYIFDKFYREQKGNIHDVKGHGLGLAYVKEIVDTHHGAVLVDSEKGKGSTFIVKLPLI
mgnify:CR=1 FL=1|tara:strand:+ start:11535 stop:13124 length:1590 start_codon:yes stop_codon:yes gene_type:complete